MTRLSVAVKVAPPALPTSPPRLQHVLEMLEGDSADDAREGQPQLVQQKMRSVLPAPIIIQVAAPVVDEEMRGEDEWEDEEDEDEYGSDDSPYLEMYEGEEVTMDSITPITLDPRMAAIHKAAAAMYAFYNSDLQQASLPDPSPPPPAAATAERSVSASVSPSTSSSASARRAPTPVPPPVPPRPRRSLQ